LNNIVNIAAMTYQIRYLLIKSATKFVID